MLGQQFGFRYKRSTQLFSQQELLRLHYRMIFNKNQHTDLASEFSGLTYPIKIPLIIVSLDTISINKSFIVKINNSHSDVKSILASIPRGWGYIIGSVSIHRINLITFLKSKIWTRVYMAEICIYRLTEYYTKKIKQTGFFSLID